MEAARELRDRYLEQVNTDPGMLLPSATGKYDVSRQLAPGSAAPSSMRIDAVPGADVPLLEAA